MRITCSFADQRFDLRLDDSPAARELIAMLPLDLTIEDYSTNEKIAYLPQRLEAASSAPFGAEAPGDVCYYAPWGNLVFFYDSYRYSRGLIRLGRLEGEVSPLRLRGRYPLHLEAQG